MNYLGTEEAETQKWLRWEGISESVLADCKIFSVKKVTSTSQCDQRKEGTFFTLDCGAWVNIIALTDTKQVLTVQQYRHGIEDLTLEIPGGCVDETDADYQAAAIRELREETGCVAERWSFLGKNHPNPALQNNLCYTFLAEGVRRLEPPQFDDTGTERILNRSIPLHEIDNCIRAGIITHSLVITAFHFLALARPELLQTES
jgi:8-oxo-dGTP pyrophosphatase MutT (NUDIX family)